MPVKHAPERQLMGTVILPGSGQRLVNVHPISACAGRPCCVHRPSDHHMRGWTMYWRWDRLLMERICEHGVGHPDPDDINPDTIHGCDGCCAPPGVD